MKRLFPLLVALGITLVDCSGAQHGTTVVRYLGGNGRDANTGSLSSDKFLVDGCFNIANLIKLLHSDGTAGLPAVYATVDFDLSNLTSNPFDSKNGFKQLDPKNAAYNAIRANILLNRSEPYFPKFFEDTVSDIIKDLVPKDSTDPQHPFPFDVLSQDGCGPGATQTATPGLIVRPIGTTPPPTTPPPTTPPTTKSNTVTISGNATPISITHSGKQSIQFQEPNGGRWREYRTFGNSLLITIYDTRPASSLCGASGAYTIKESFILSTGDALLNLPMKATMLNVFTDPIYKIPIFFQTDKAGKRTVMPSAYETVLKTMAPDLTPNCPKN